MRSLDKKDLTLNWEEPKNARIGTHSRIPENFIAIYNFESIVVGKKKNNKYLSFASAAAEKYGATGKVSFSFEKDKRLIACFNPNPGVPFYKLTTNNKAKRLGNGPLIDKIYEFFGLEKGKKYLLKIYYWATLNEMELCILTPQHFDTMTPVFEDELIGVS